MHNRDFRREEREKGIKNVFQEIMAENFTNLQKEADIQVQEGIDAMFPAPQADSLLMSHQGSPKTYCN